VTYRIGVLGTGNISGTHARAAAEIPGVEVAAVFGRDREKAARIADEYGATAYDDLDRFLRHPSLDVVLVGSPSGLHGEHGIAAARAGHHVLVEKPLEITPARADALISAAREAGVRLGVFFQNRTMPEIAWLKRLVDTGGMGRVFLASAQVKWYRPPEYYGGSRWRGTWSLDGGGALMNQAIHTVDLLLWMLGDVRRVHARALTALHEIEVEDTVVATLEFASGAVATLEATTAAYPGYPRRMELTGTEGTVTLEHDRVRDLDLRSPPAEPLPREAADETASASSPIVSDVRGHRRVIEDFLRSIESGEPPLCDGPDGRRSVEVVDAVYRSARGREEVGIAHR
jgi:predicted dehydrogenase